MKSLSQLKIQSYFLLRLLEIQNKPNYVIFKKLLDENSRKRHNRDRLYIYREKQILYTMFIKMQHEYRY